MLRLQLLGAPSVFDDLREIYLPSQKAQALLFYLAAEYGRSFSRSQIIALLWEESSEREGRNSLSTVLTRLRQSLPIFVVRARPIRRRESSAWRRRRRSIAARFSTASACAIAKHTMSGCAWSASAGN